MKWPTRKTPRQKAELKLAGAVVNLVDASLLFDKVGDNKLSAITERMATHAMNAIRLSGEIERANGGP